MAANNNQSGEATSRPNQPIVLPPAPGNADPAPLIETLARVALAIARRRAQVRPSTDSADGEAPEEPQHSQTNVIMYTLPDETVVL